MKQALETPLLRYEQRYSYLFVRDTSKICNSSRVFLSFKANSIFKYVFVMYVRLPSFAWRTPETRENTLSQLQQEDECSGQEHIHWRYEVGHPCFLQGTVRPDCG